MRPSPATTSIGWSRRSTPRSRRSRRFVREAHGYGSAHRRSFPRWSSRTCCHAGRASPGEEQDIVPTHLLASPASRDYADAQRLAGLSALGPELLGAHCTAATSEDLDCPRASRRAGCALPDRQRRVGNTRVGRTDARGRAHRRARQRQRQPERQLRHPRRSAPCRFRVAGDRRPFDLDQRARRAFGWRRSTARRAIGLGDQVGSLTPGKLADLIVVDTSAAHWWPRHDWLDALVMQGRSTDVRTVVIDGRIVMHDRVITGLDPDAEAALHRDAQRASTALLERAGLGP